MKLGSWELDIGFPYHSLPGDGVDFDLAMKKSRPYWNNIGIHLSHERTNEWYMLEVRLSWKYGAQAYYSHYPPYWLIMACNHDECQQEKRRIKRKNNTRPKQTPNRPRYNRARPIWRAVKEMGLSRKGVDELIEEAKTETRSRH